MGIRTGGRFRMSAKRQIEQRQKALQSLDKMIEDGRAYSKLRQTKTRKAEEYHNEDLRFESLLEYVNGNLPIYVQANEVRQIEAAVNWSKRHVLKIIIVGGRDAWRTTKLLKDSKVPVIYESVTPFHHVALRIMIKHINRLLYYIKLASSSALHHLDQLEVLIE